MAVSGPCEGSENPFENACIVVSVFWPGKVDCQAKINFAMDEVVGVSTSWKKGKNTERKKCR